MIKKNLVAFMVAFMVVGLFGTNFVTNAEALKGKGVGISQFGSDTDICGLMSCSDYPGGKDAYKADWVSMFRSTESVTQQIIDEAKVDHHTSISSNNTDDEFSVKLDEVIHKFELDKISADEALDGIKEAHYGFVDLYITSEIIEAVEGKIALIDSGKLSGADAVEAIHLTAEPQNVNPELIGALDEYLHKYELDKISADEAIHGVMQVHSGFVDLYITSNLVESIDVQLNIYESGIDSASHVLYEIHEVIEEEESIMTAALLSVDGEVLIKELPPNTVDMPIGAGVPGCETNNMCYTPTHLTVHPGTTVTWINSDGSIPHTVTVGWVDSESIGLDYPGGNGFDSDFMSGGAEFEHTFEVPGEYDYYCQLHPWMIGSITVE